jgi:hypothetical protein
MEFAEQRKKNTRTSSLRLILLGGAVLFLFLSIQLFAPARADLWWQVFFEALHAPIFGLIAVCLLAMTPPTWHLQGRLIVSLAAAFLLAIMSEVVQIPMPNRSASFGDLFNDMVGALAFVSAAVVLSPNFHVPRGRGRWLILLAAILMVWPLKPLASVSAAYWERYEQLPSIAPFESRNSHLFYNLNNATMRFATADYGAGIVPEFHFNQTGSSSIDFHDPWSDWRSYEALVLDIDNLDSKTLPLTIRIHDEAHLIGDQPHEDRFNRRLDLAPGRHSINLDLAEVKQAPDGRDMDMGHIDGLVLFGTEKEAGSRFVIHDIRLE